MNIGRKVYYEITTGNVICDTGERSGSVVATTEDQDFAMYAALQPYQKNAVGLIQLNYGDHYQDFLTCNPRVDLSTNTLVFDPKAGPTLTDVKQAKINQLNTAYQNTLSAGFQVTIGSTAYTFGWSTDDKANMNGTQTAIDKGFATFPINYADVNGNPVSIPDQTTLNTIEQTATKFAFAQHQQILTLIGNVNTAADSTTVNNIQWTAASYA